VIHTCIPLQTHRFTGNPAAYTQGEQLEPQTTPVLIAFVLAASAGNRSKGMQA